MRIFDCDECGLAPVDLPDGVDPELIFSVFETEDGGKRHLCVGCAMGMKAR